MYPISRQGLAANTDYIEQEKEQDQEKWQSPALFLSPLSIAHSDRRLPPEAINTVRNQVREVSGVDGDKTPHSARLGRGGVHYGGNPQGCGGATAARA